MRRLTLNVAARRLDKFADAQKVRAHTKKGVIFIRPTNRANDLNLDRSAEQLVPLVDGKFQLDSRDAPTGTYSLRPEAYGWFALVPGHNGQGPAIRLT